MAAVMLPTVTPWVWKFGAAALVVSAAGVGGYVMGRESKQGELDALRQSYEFAYAKAAGAARERERMWSTSARVAGERFDEANKLVSADRDDARRSLRERAEGARLRIAASSATAGSCPVGGPGFEELLRKGEELEELVSAGARLSNALNACLAAWPK